MTNDLLYTKLQVPPLRDASVPRPRLIALLDEALPQDGAWQRKLTLASAPAGYGKTTLLSAWGARLPHPVAWISLDKDDNDPIRFLSYLAAALQSIDVCPGADLKAITAAPSSSTLPLLVAITNEIFRSAQPFMLVLDDVLRTGSGPGKHQSHVAGFAYVRLGDIARETNELEKARRYLEKGITMCEQWGLADAVVDAYAARARLHFACDEPAEMRRALATAGALCDAAQVDPFIVTRLDACRLRLWIYERDFDAVRGWMANSSLTEHL